jgi:cytochrome c oxidase subunit 2
MNPSDYQRWLAGGAGQISPVEAGQKLFVQLGCNSCHQAIAAPGTPTSTARGANLIGLFGKPVQLQNGQTVMADENYIRESILDPSAKIAAGYPAIMPTFKGLVSEENLVQLVAFLKSLSTPGGGKPPP